MALYTLQYTNQSRQYLQEINEHEAAEKYSFGGSAQGEQISNMPEDLARDAAIGSHGTPEERFWMRQRGVTDTITIGRRYIAKVCSFSQTMDWMLTKFRLHRTKPRKTNDASDE
jgi:hypothetical protein